MQWQREQVLALAPDAASVKAAQGLIGLSKWPTLGATELALWGECQGSGAKPYQTAIDLTELAFQCSCPSRKFPCKHGLALFLLYLQSADPFVTQVTPPPWVQRWLEGRAKRRANEQAQPAATPDPTSTTTRDEAAEESAVSAATTSRPAPRKRANAREEKVAAGIAELRTWLQDLVRAGFADAQRQPYPFWQQMAARLIDAQAPGLATQVTTLGSIAASGGDWAERLTAAVGRLFLLVEAYGRLDSLPTKLQQEVRTLIGWYQSREEVLAGQGLRDEWLVLSQNIESEETLLSQRVWLRGVQSERYGLILNFAHPSNRQSLDAFWRPGSAMQATLFYYGSVTPLRAIATAVQPAAEPSAVIAGQPLAPALRDYQQALAQNPWLTRYPLLLADVTVGRDPAGGSTGQWVVYDQSQAMISISRKSKRQWQLLSISGGAPVQLFGEWLDDGLLPLGLWQAGRYQPL